MIWSMANSLSHVWHKCRSKILHHQRNSIRNCMYGYINACWSNNLSVRMHLLSLLYASSSPKSSSDRSHALLQRLRRMPAVQKVSERPGCTSSSSECQFSVWGHFSISIQRKIKFTRCSSRGKNRAQTNCYCRLFLWYVGNEWNTSD